jgi:hypothetical protein
VLLDPLLSRLGGNLDSHKDADVRKALEPLVAMADRTRSSILGLIHVNKSGSTDPLTALMASRAFSAVARSVLFAMADPDEEGMRLLGQPKNNLGPEQKVLAYRIIGTQVEQDGEEAIGTGKVEWLGEREGSIADRLETAAQSTTDRTAVGDAVEWLDYYLTSKGGEDDSAVIKRTGLAQGHSKDALGRARLKLGLLIVNRHTVPRTTCWALPAEPVSDMSVNSHIPVDASVPPSPTTATTATTGQPATGEAYIYNNIQPVVAVVATHGDGDDCATTGLVESLRNRPVEDVDPDDWNRPLRGGYL